MVLIRSVSTYVEPDISFRRGPGRKGSPQTRVRTVLENFFGFENFYYKL